MKSSRIIINVHDRINHYHALMLIAHVVDGGKISETRGIKHYCAVTTFENDKVVQCNITRTGSIRFDVYQDKPAKVKV